MADGAHAGALVRLPTIEDVMTGEQKEFTMPRRDPIHHGEYRRPKGGRLCDRAITYAESATFYTSNTTKNNSTTELSDSERGGRATVQAAKVVKHSVFQTVKTVSVQRKKKKLGGER